MRSSRCARSTAPLVWNAAHYIKHASFQADFARECLQRGSPSLESRLSTAASLLDIGAGTGEHTRAMALKMPRDAFATGMDSSPQMVRAARKLQGRAAQTTDGAETRFIAEDLRLWSDREELRGVYDLATSFMALHWITEAQLPATLAGIRHSLDSSNGFLFASCHGVGSMRALFDAIDTVVDAASASTPRSTSSSHTGREGEPQGATSWGDVPAALAGERWAPNFPRGRDDFVPITMLTIDAWKAYLSDAGFEVSATDSVSMRSVKTIYVDKAATAERLNAAWGPMFPTLAVNQRSDFFEDVAEEAVRAAEVSACEPRPVVVESMVVDIAVGVVKQA